MSTGLPHLYFLKYTLHQKHKLALVCQLHLFIRTADIVGSIQVQVGAHMNFKWEYIDEDLVIKILVGAYRFILKHNYLRFR